MRGGCVGPYRLVAELGSGGMGTVHLAERDGARVALKIVHPRLLATPGFFKRFLREAEIGKRIRHENVVATLDVDAVESDGALHHFLVMEYVEGQTLRALLDELGRVPEELCRHIGREVAKGLAAIHAAGVVHRDMKPDNVLITKDHVVKVMDLGVARLADEALRLSQTGVFVGSVQYAAPEQFRGGEVDGRVDLHALGLILNELSTAQHPYQADDFRAVMRRVLDEKPRRPAEINPQLSPFFEELVLQLLEKDRSKRFASAADVAQILDDGEKSAWWHERAKAIRATTKRPLRRIRIPRETALYGREVELAKLRALYDAAKSGDGRVVLIEGEAGIGKSRLVDEFVGLLQREGEDLNFLFGSYPPGGAATASGAFSTAYREQFGEDGCAAWLSQTPVLVPAFDALLRGETTPSGVEPLTKDSLQTVFVHATRNLAAERPTIVLIDDLHFAPEEGRALFAALAMAVPGHRVLLVGTTRPGIDERWLSSLDRVGAARIALARLGAKDLVRLLADTLKSEHLAEELAGRIAVKSDGNPFFVFEILRGLREGQFITKRDDGTWVSTRVIADIQIPSSVLDLVQARVADLSQDERNALDVASCLGFEFDPSLVAAVLGVGRIPLLQRLAHVEKAHRLVRSCGRRFVFDHHQVQEALYGGLPELLREEYHAAIGDAIERASGAAAKAPAEIDGALCIDLAEQFLKGAQGTQALRYIDSALTHLEKGYLNDAAVRLADRALEVPGLFSGSLRCALLLRRSTALGVRGRSDEKLVTLREASALADFTGDAGLRARVFVELGGHLEHLSFGPDAETALVAAAKLARIAGDRALEGVACGALGVVFEHSGRIDEARRLYETDLNVSHDAGDRRHEAVAAHRLANAYSALGMWQESRGLLERSLAVAQATGDRQTEASGLSAMATHALRQGQIEDSRSLYEQALHIARSVGTRKLEATAVGNLAGALVALGRLAEAYECDARYLLLAREIGFRYGEAIASYNLGRSLEKLGRARESDSCLARSLEISRDIGFRVLEAVTLRAVGEQAAERHQDSDAERHLRASHELFAALGTGDEETLATTWSLGAFLLRTGRRDEGCRLLESVLATAEAGSMHDVRVRAMIELAVHGEADAADAILPFSAAEGRLGLTDRMTARFDLWKVTHERAHLAEAKRLLDFMVAHAPPEYRVTMLANVRLHREITEASAS